MKAARSAIAVAFACCPVAAHATSPAEQTIPATRLVEVARAALPAPAPDSGLTMTVRVIGAPANAVVPPGAVALHAQVPAGRWPRARVAVPVDIRVGNRIARRETVWFAVEAERTGLVYVSDAASGTPAGALKMQTGEVDVAAAEGVPMQTSAQLTGERLRRGVHAGWPVLQSDFETIPAVDRNARVVVHVRYGAIHMQTVATALEPGDIGDAIPVLVEGGQSPVQARVEAKGVVDIGR